MTDLIKTLLSLSLSGTLLILVFFLLKPLWKDRLSKQWQYYIWLIVIVRLLLPFAPKTNFVGIIFQQAETNMLSTGQNVQEATDMLTEKEQAAIAGSKDNDTREQKLLTERTPLSD